MEVERKNWGAGKALSEVVTLELVLKGLGTWEREMSIAREIESHASTWGYLIFPHILESEWSRST